MTRRDWLTRVLIGTAALSQAALGRTSVTVPLRVSVTLDEINARTLHTITPQVVADLFSRPDPFYLAYLRG